MDNILRTYCKLYTIIFFLLIVESRCHDSNETSSEHRQSRVTGRIVKLYSGTRPEPILCAGEGFQGDPNDCAVFYRCMKSGRGKYTVFRFQCGPGTVYDPETEVCNHPRSTKRIECGGLSTPAPTVDRLNNNEIEGVQNEIPSPITSLPIRIETTTGAQTIFSTVYPWVTPGSTINNPTKRQTFAHSTGFTNAYTTAALPETSVTQSQQYTTRSTHPPTSTVTQISSRDNICTSDGFMGDSENCRKFYRCVGNQRGTYTRFEFSCSESTIWDDDTQSCNHAWAVKRSRCGRSSQDSQYGTNKDVLQKPTSTDKTIQQQLQISYGSDVTQTQTQVSNGSVIQNQTQINFGDRLNSNRGTKATQNQTQISHGSATSQSQTQIDFSDKGVQTQLQIDHSKQSSQSSQNQSQVQVHASTTKGPSTSTSSSTPHASSQESNMCSRSGFMGDTNDCKKFYRCIDNGRGGYTKFEFSCGQGTVWDQSIEACNHAWAVKECGGKGPIETTSTTKQLRVLLRLHKIIIQHLQLNIIKQRQALFPRKTEDSGYGQQNQNPTAGTTASSSTTLSSTTVVSTTAKLPSNGNCQSSGFIGDANDCKIFYRCVENGRGGFTKYEFKCGEGTVWDPDLEACNHAWAVKRCGGHASSDDHKVDTTTEKAPTLSTVHTQTTVVTQSPTESAATQDDDYDTGYGSVNNDISSSTTTTTKQPQKEDNVGNVCRSSGFMGDENDCKKFYRCVDNGNGGYIRYDFTCGEGTVWDPKIEACNHAWAVEKCGGSTVNNQEATTANPATTVEEADKGTTESIHSTVASTISSSSSSTSSTTESTSSGSNECTRDGFMGDPKDCKKFYRCVDNGKGSFTKYEFSCGEGTVWDQKIEACNHAWAVEKCGGTAVSSPTHLETTTLYRPTMNDEIDNGYPSNIDTGYEISTQKTTTTQSVPSSSVAAGEGNSCTTSGFVGDKHDCKKFYRCVDNGYGGFIRYEFSCGEGTLWDQSIEACNHAWAVKDCGTGINTIHTSSQSPAHVTSTSDNEDQGYPQSTEKTTTTTVSTYPDEGTSGECSKEGFIGDKRNCKKFYRCVDNGRGGYTKYEFTCGEGTYWNQEILSCDHATSTKPCGEIESSSSTQTSETAHDEIYTEITSSSTEENIYQTQKPSMSSGVCTSEGFYGDPNDCKKFYRCVDNGKGSYTKYDFTCGDGTVWDQEIQACNHESNNRNCSSSSSSQSTSTSQTTEKSPEAGSSTTTVTQIQHSTEKTDSSSVSSSNQCTSEGFFADPNDCKKFIRCVSNEKGGYTKYEFSCGEGTIWVQDILACDHDTDKTTCSPQSTTRPSTSEGHPQTTEKVEASTSTSRPQTTDKLEDEYDSGTSDKPTQPGSGVCSSEGFYGNENDCRQFYRCVDNGQGGYTKYDFTCGEGTAWDSEIQTCNHIDQVKNCHGTSESHPVMHDEDNTQSTGTSSAPESSTAASSTSSSTSTSSTTNSESSQGSSSPNKNSCDSEGYFGDTQDCKKFYRCVDNGKGGYTKYDYVCGEGTIWDQDITTCNHPQDVVNPSCNQKQESTTSTTMATASSSDFSSSSSPTDSTQSSSTQSSTESTQSSSAQTTQSTSNCSQEDSSKKPVNQNITCDKAGYYPNPNDCKKFYRCVDWDGDGKRFSVYHFECGEGTIWDPAVETCNHEESVYPPRDCSGTQSQSENQPPATEGTTTTQQETSSSQGSTTQSSSTSQSTTQSTTTEPTTQQSTTSEQTTTQQSTSSAQTTTEKSTTSEPATTQSSTTSESTTQSSTTSEQTTQSSTTSEQTTQSSTTSEQTTQSSTTSEQTTQSSTTSEQTTQSSTTSESTTQSSTTSEPTTTEQSTTTDQITTEQSTTSEPTTEQSTTAEQTTQESTTTEQSTTEQSTTEQSTTESTTESSTTESSTTESSTTESSTTESTTTEQSTTQQSTTTEQSTTEESTSSEGTTTEQSTTEQTTTEQTTESSTTESGSENTSESKCPETNDDQSLFVCPTSFRRHPKYCNLFYQCDENNDTHDVKIAVFTCPNNTIYDENQTRCVEENNADKKCDGQIAQKRRFKRLDKHYKEPLVASKESYKCSSAGYFSFEKESECSPAFLKCKTDKTNKIRGFVYQCPNGYVYWSISKRCEPINRVRDCKRSNNDWSERWEIPVERRNVAPSSA
nr:LOW QUALITY PROTEIN: mucin-22 [Helicoverpa armigera]